MSVTRASAVAVLAGGIALAAVNDAAAQDPERCRVVCDLEWKFEPTFTLENLAKRHRVVTADGGI